MVYGSSTELAVELLSAEVLEVIYGVGPEVQHIVPGESVSLLDQNHFGSQEGQLNGCAKATGATANDQTLRRKKEEDFTLRSRE